LLPDLARDIWVLIHPDLQDWPPMQRVREQLIRLFRDQAPALAGRTREGEPAVA